MAFVTVQAKPSLIFLEANWVLNIRNLFQDSLWGTVHISFINMKFAKTITSFLRYLCLIFLRTLCRIVIFFVIVEISNMTQALFVSLVSGKLVFSTRYVSKGGFSSLILPKVLILIFCQSIFSKTFGIDLLDT